MTTSAGPEAARPPQQRQWTWEHPVGPRWLLLGDVGFEGSYQDGLPLAPYAEIEGLFVNLPPRPRERFTLVGSTPDGALAGLLDRLPIEALGLWPGSAASAEQSRNPTRLLWCHSCHRRCETAPVISGSGSGYRPPAAATRRFPAGHLALIRPIPQAQIQPNRGPRVSNVRVHTNIVPLSKATAVHNAAIRALRSLLAPQPQYIGNYGQVQVRDQNGG